ncbi:uroporphyrinogen-III C-methyltransferase [Alkalihalobacillus sp. MEB130]|uniref:uroporphyrinogen-III C-methyltransferase n=1 Tax=Alkalihalobacillus sp. MEB130 TaxID=2976704 RepID=UPI0028DE581B|nr:uroporphyrinogen-III C-methyltransferase [Alkalihalobacillus sp. MEB130]MDT8862792.1 uroporphyrinogen-III C-methyltransferase [Alkalihalobacillus sp. MEB130]
MNKGMVYFVGAGPGDIDLMTVKGKKVLQQADVVIFDRLINPFLLTDVKEDAKLIYCGKQPCKHTLRQEDIQKEILIHARKGKTVVRLKGGDPAVFGRVGEEAEQLAENHINYEIIPGITAGIAASMYAGVPITHRNHSKSFAVVTGHGSKEDGTPQIEWDSLSKGVETIVFYMGVKHLKTIATQLTKHGKSKETAVLVVQWGTYSKQKTVEGTLATIANKVEQANVTNPAIIVVGDVVKLRNKLAWFDNKPLTGKGILIPSKQLENKELVATLKKHGADVFEHELFTEEKVKDTLSFKQLTEASSEQELVFLSAQSVDLFLKALGEHELDLRDIKSTFVSVNQEVKTRLQMVGLPSFLLEEKALSDPIVVGREIEIETFNWQYSKSLKNLMVAKKKVVNKDIESFTRLIEEEHVNTILLTNHVDVLTFLSFLTVSGVSKEKVLKKVKVVCNGREASLLVKANKIPIDQVLEKNDLAQIVEILEETSLIKESLS